MNLFLVFSLAVIGSSFAGDYEQTELPVSLKMEARVAIDRGVGYLNRYAGSDKTDCISLEQVVWGLEVVALLQDVDNRNDQQKLSEFFSGFLHAEMEELLRQWRGRDKEVYRLALISKGILLAKPKFALHHEAEIKARECLFDYMQHLMLKKEKSHISTLSAVWQALHLMMFDREKIASENELFWKADRWIIEGFQQRLLEVCASNKQMLSTNPDELVRLLIPLSYYPISPSAHSCFEVCCQMLFKELVVVVPRPVTIRLAQLARSVSKNKAELTLACRKWRVASVENLLANQSASGGWESNVCTTCEKDCIGQTLMALRLLVEFIR
jgi:hypothetical protein